MNAAKLSKNPETTKHFEIFIKIAPIGNDRDIDCLKTSYTNRLKSNIVSGVGTV